MGRGSGRLAAFLLTLAILCVVRVDGDFHPPRVTLRKDLPQIIPVSDVDRIVLDDYKLCGDAYVIKSLYYCQIKANGLPRRKKCENLCGDPKDDARCTEKCPIYKQCVLGLSGENETMCLRFFEFKTHAEVMNPPTTESPTAPELAKTTVEVTTEAKKTVKAKKLKCPVSINCDAQQVDCSKCPGPGKDAPANLRYLRLLEINREQLRQIGELKVLHNRNPEEKCHCDGMSISLTVVGVVLFIVVVICFGVICFLVWRLRCRPACRDNGEHALMLNPSFSCLGCVDKQPESTDEHENL